MPKQKLPQIRTKELHRDAVIAARDRETLIGQLRDQARLLRNEYWVEEIDRQALLRAAEVTERAMNVLRTN